MTWPVIRWNVVHEMNHSSLRHHEPATAHNEPETLDTKRAFSIGRRHAMMRIGRKICVHWFEVDSHGIFPGLRTSPRSTFSESARGRRAILG
jgi:hypothetical protein